MKELLNCVKSGEIVIKQRLIDRLKDYQKDGEDNGLDRDISTLSEAVIFLCLLVTELDGELLNEAYSKASRICFVINNLKDLTKYSPENAF